MFSVFFAAVSLGLIACVLAGQLYGLSTARGLARLMGAVGGFLLILAAKHWFDAATFAAFFYGIAFMAVAAFLSGLLASNRTQDNA